MASVIEELNEVATTLNPPCSFVTALNKLKDDNVAKQLDEALKSGVYSLKTIQIFLKRRSISVGNDSISNHKRGLCKCQIPSLKN